MTTALLQTTYFGPVQWYQKLHRYDCCLIEQYDSYQKQTYRNRCLIATANGVQALTVPVEHPAALTSHRWSKTFASATTTSGAATIGMRCRVLTARVLSLSIMPTTSDRSSNRNTTI